MSVLRPGGMLGQYRIGEEIGRGGMGAVYRAFQPALNRQVAIKVLPPEFAHNPALVARFRQEANAIASLRHPNIVTIHEIGQMDSCEYIVTEFVEGETLRTRMLRGPLDPAAEAADGSNAVPRVPIRRAVTNGMRYLIGQPFLRTVAIWSAAVNAVAAAMLLMVIVLARSRGATPLVIGGMFSVNAACGLAGALTAPRLINLVGGRRMALTTSWLLPACAVGSFPGMCDVCSAFTTTYPA